MCGIVKAAVSSINGALKPISTFFLLILPIKKHTEEALALSGGLRRLVNSVVIILDFPCTFLLLLWLSIFYFSL